MLVETWGCTAREGCYPRNSYDTGLIKNRFGRAPVAAAADSVVCGGKSARGMENWERCGGEGDASSPAACYAFWAEVRSHRGSS